MVKKEDVNDRWTKIPVKSHHRQSKKKEVRLGVGQARQPDYISFGSTTPPARAAVAQTDGQTVANVVYSILRLAPYQPAASHSRLPRLINC